MACNWARAPWLTPQSNRAFQALGRAASGTPFTLHVREHMHRKRPHRSFDSQFRRYFWGQLDSSQLARLFVNACGVERNSRVPVISQRFRQLRYRLATELISRGVELPSELRVIRFSYPFPVNAWHRRMKELSNIALKTAPCGRLDAPQAARHLVQR